MKISVVQCGSLCLFMLLGLDVTTAFDRQDDAESLNKLWSQGYAEFEKGNVKDAQKCIEQVIKVIPYEPSSRILMARCQAKLNDTEGAIHSLAKASELGWQDANSVKSYDELRELVDLPAFKQALSAMDENRKRPFVLYIGNSVDRSKAAPLIVLYHGRGELPNIQLHFWKEAADRAGCLLLALKGTRTVGSVFAWESQNAKHTWQIDTQAVLAETSARINEVIKANNISKIVLAGFSQGGVAAIEMLASEFKPRPVGGVLFATAFPDQPTEMFAKKSSIPSCPVIVHVGGNDRWLKGNKAVVDHLKKLGVPVSFRVWDGMGHQMPPNHTQVILDSINELLENE
jgi:predicted esterase